MWPDRQMVQIYKNDLNWPLHGQLRSISAIAGRQLASPQNW